MIRNLILVTLRNFRRDKGYNALNILGLTIGITFSLLLGFYIMDEVGYDRYHEKADRIYRIVSNIVESDNTTNTAVTQFPLGPTVKNEYPEVEQAVRLVDVGSMLFDKGDSKFYENKIYSTDSNYFRVFTASVVEGDPLTALAAPYSMVITQTLARKYFGNDANVVGKSLSNNNGEVYKITAIVKDPPKKSHLLYNALISISTLPKDYSSNWGGLNTYTYVLLYPKTNVKSFEAKLSVLYDKYMAPIFLKSNMKIRDRVQPITDIHLHSDLTMEPEEVGSASYVYIFSAVALFILFIACINYMNLATARSSRRAKEIGIRKVAGSLRFQLVGQFLIESIATAIIALILSLGFIYFLLPVFNSLSNKELSISGLMKPDTFFLILFVILFVGLISGSYPALYLSKFNPIQVLKGGLPMHSGNVRLRRSLVVLQFSVSIVMLICTSVVYAQLQFMRNKNLGFNKEYVVSVNAGDEDNTRQRLEAFKNEMGKNPHILSISTSQRVPGQLPPFNLYSIESKNGFIDKAIDHYRVDEGFIQTLGVQLIQGKNFVFSSTDSMQSVIVNQKMVKVFGWDNAIGKKIKRPADISGKYYEVIGVVKDFNQNSLYNPITPLALFYKPDLSNVLIKINAGNIPATISFIENTWKKIFPNLSFDYSFLDQDFDSQYAADKKRSKIFIIFSSLTIIITCLGILGLVAFTTEQRQKEISILKIVGADISQIMFLIIKNFLSLIGLSCLIAFPIAWYLSYKWLEIFPYRVGLNINMFFFSGALVLLLTLITVSFHTIKAAIANPAKNLRSE